MFDKITAFGVLVSLVGCGTLVPTTVARLAGVSPLNADPAGFEVALDLPQGVGVRPGSAILGFEAARSDTGEAFAQEFQLEMSPGTPPTWRFAEADLAAIRQFQAQARAWESDAPAASSGSISVGLGPCLIGDGPAAEAVISSALRIQQGGPFLPLMRNVALLQFADAADISALPACP